MRVGILGTGFVRAGHEVKMGRETPGMSTCGRGPATRASGRPVGRLPKPQRLVKTTVAKVCTDFGWKVIDIGGIEGSRYLESLTMIWNHAFKLLRR